MKVIFTPLAESHLELLHDWLNRPHVLTWWGNEPKTLMQVKDKYIPRISGLVPSRGFICFGSMTGALATDSTVQPIGYIQTHWLADFPDYAGDVGEGVNPSMASVDVFIGDEHNLHRGLGQLIMRQFLAQVVFGEMNADSCTVGPLIDNKASIRAYEKAGFTHWKTVDVKDSGLEYILKIERADFLQKQ